MHNRLKHNQLSRSPFLLLLLSWMYPNALRIIRKWGARGRGVLNNMARHESCKLTSLLTQLGSI
jgi:hypothetical protein